MFVRTISNYDDEWQRRLTVSLLLSLHSNFSLCLWVEKSLTDKYHLLNVTIESSRIRTYYSLYFVTGLILAHWLNWDMLAHKVYFILFGITCFSNILIVFLCIILVHMTVLVSYIRTTCNLRSLLIIRQYKGKNYSILIEWLARSLQSRRCNDKNISL